MLWKEFGFELEEGAWDFGIAFGDWYADNWSVDNNRVVKKDGLNFRKCDLPTMDLMRVCRLVVEILVRRGSVEGS